MDNYGSMVEPFLEKAEWRCALNVNGKYYFHMIAMGDSISSYVINTTPDI